MNNNRPVEPAGGLSLGDIYYVIFRHKWKILLCSLLGLAGAAAVYFFHPPPYQSQAEFLIEYVPKPTQLGLDGDNEKVIMTDPRGDDIISSEIQILTSMDIAEEAATNIGPSNILPGANPNVSPLSAAAYIRNNLKAEPADKDSSVIVVTFIHPQPQMVQTILQEVINDYFEKHYEIHSAGGKFDDALTMEQSALNVQLNATEQQIADLKNKANIISLDDSQKDIATQLAKTRDDILDAQAALAGDEAAMKQTGTGQAMESQTTNVQLAVPKEQLDAYDEVCENLDDLHKKEQNYLNQGFTISNVLVKEVDGQIISGEKAKAGFEKKYPQIAGLAIVPTATTGVAASTIADPRVQIAEIASLQAKIKAWNEQLVQLQMQATNLNNLAPTIAQLEQEKAIQEANYQNLSVSLEKSHIDQALDPGKSPDIKWVQTPSPPVRDWTKTHKKIAVLAVGGVFAGLAWAFLIELFFDRSVKRPAEVESKLKLPLLLSIPDINRNGYAALGKATERKQLLLNDSEVNGTPSANGHSSLEKNGALPVVSLEQNHSLLPFFEALGDRLISYFEIKGLTHKPKLVAVTGTTSGAGVSTIAAGLAASLSGTGDGNVLLVDMNIENGAAQQFYKGRAVCGLDTALKNESRQDALVRDNLYVVNGNSNNSSLPDALPKRFSVLVPKLKASEYDYIIFDMPVVSPTSITSRLARFMDITLLIVESEKTDRDVIIHANQWLSVGGANVSVVLNKTRQYVPGRLHQEFLSYK